MKQKYVILKDDETDEFILREFAELDKEALSLLCEERYGREALETAVEKGPGALVQTLRTPNMYPPASYVGRIADRVIALVSGEEESPVEIVLDDVENIIRDRKEAAEAAEAAEDDSADLDELLDDDDSMEDDFEDDDIPSIDSNSSIKIADDDSLDVDDEG